ncbi:CopD family protein [Eilatimonas milleporae]|uniref:Protoporphyrinogen IX oxidase n=1 Tax=Eilatimonas milleporae TaxID=911205 RepID=A0A3M0CGY5_9PROT|nr:CopD family protein [Eilatimonas milleporae]RMB08057.1 putative membrane protein [Eilatimonas milleporae]
MIYDFVKIAHIASMVLWMGLAFTVPMVALALARQADGGHQTAIAALRQAHLRLGGPGIVATWVFGLALLSLGGWFNAPWMPTKIIFVVFLSGLHGALSGHLKKIAWAGDGVPARFFKILLLLHAAGLAAVLALVVLKPF